MELDYVEQQYESRRINQYISQVKENQLCIDERLLDLFHTKNALQTFAFVDQLGIEELTILNCQCVSFDRVPAKVKELSVNNCNISQINGVQNITDLYLLDLQSNNRIEHITCLQQMFNLTSLNLSGNAIEIIYPLRKLTNLLDLDVSFNSVIDISALSSLMKLKSLALCVNQIVDIYPVRNLINLQKLYLDGNEIIDLFPLQNMNLEQLVLNDNFISDFNNFEQFKTEQRVPTPIQVLFQNKLKQIHFQDELGEQMKEKMFKAKRKQNDFIYQINKTVVQQNG
ncbi:leucine-rich_repeat domain-containing protein [Hexamita inflata]|uniref:Leucine-rich_repeat domain-containing protein n=1 Tax=Hexamita inflata TaxID=28002 RepID=A0ABP1HPA9_9EUKA